MNPVNPKSLGGHSYLYALSYAWLAPRNVASIMKAGTLSFPRLVGVRSEAGPSSADVGLLARLRARDMVALDEVCAAYGESVRRMAWLMVGDSAAADDIAQEAMIAVWDGARRARDDTRLGVWISGIALNMCRQEIRKRGRRKRREARAAQERPEFATVAGVSPDEAALIRKAIESLDQDHREVVVLRYLRELSVAEVATLLEIPEGTVKSRTRAAIERLRKVIPHWWADE